MSSESEALATDAHVAAVLSWITGQPDGWDRILAIIESSDEGFRGLQHFINNLLVATYAPLDLPPGDHTAIKEHLDRIYAMSPGMANMKRDIAEQVLLTYINRAETGGGYPAGTTGTAAIMDAMITQLALAGAEIRRADYPLPTLLDLLNRVRDQVNRATSST